MAISGLHIGLVAAWAFVAGRLLGAWLPGLRRRGTLGGRVCACAGAIGYAALAGFTIPTVRALLMVLMAALSPGLRDGASAWRVLSAALLAVLLWQPLAPLSSGFWLSFVAVAVLLLPALRVAPRRVQRRPAAMMTAGVATAMIQLRLSLALAIPLLGLFGGVSLVSPLANLAAVPIFAFLVVPLTLVGTLLAALGLTDWPLLLAAWLLERVLDWLGGLAAWSAADWVPMPRANWSIWLGAMATACLAWPGWLPARWLMLPLLGPALLGAPPLAPPVELRVVVMDVGQGLAVLVQTRGHSLVYDAGPRFARGDAGAAVAVPVARHYGVRVLDTIVISHADADHAGGLPSLRRAYPGARVWRPAFEASAAIGDAACVSGRAWTWDGVRFEFLHPEAGPAPTGRSRNDTSCVLLIQSPHASVLLPGDISMAVEGRLVRRLPPVSLDLVLAAHHGSATSSGSGFVAAARARHVVIANGYRNRWGFPAADVQRRWQESGACLWSTAEHGALVFEVIPRRGLALRWFFRGPRAPVWTLRGPAHGDCVGI
jgi:competence protein ComEC